MDPKASDIRFGRCTVDPAQRRLLVDGEPARLGARAFDLLLALIERRDRVVGKKELLDRVWPGLVVEENNLQVHISTLRKLLGPQVIATIPGRGYRFAAALESPPAAPVDPRVRADARDETPSSPLTNLPARLQPIFGRDDDIRAVGALLRRHPLVSIVGAGGIGKTRLALAVGDALRMTFADGVWWIELAATSDAAVVANTVAQALGIAVTPERPAAATLVSVLKRQAALLVLDNCEHLLDAAARLVETLLRECPALRVLVTSQEALKLPEEHAYRLASLAVPAQDEPVPAEAGAVALFIARAQAADPRLRFDAASLPTVAAICRALDGIPLAIELAAARVPLLGIDGLHQRLHERFRVLTGGARMVLRRHQTLRAAHEWSHGLLTDEEKLVFRRLGVFAGGFPLELAQAVAADETIDRWAVLDLLGHLVDKSLVTTDAADLPRYHLLETTRAFALEQLAAAGETTTLLRRHAESLYHYLAPLRDRYWTLNDADFARGPAELDNLRAALDWAESPEGDRRLACALIGVSNLCWHATGQLMEGLERCRRLLPLPAYPPDLEARFQLTYARLGYLGARADCCAAADRAAQLFRELNDASGLADALIARAMVGSRRAETARVDAAVAEAERLIGPASPPKQRASLALAQALRHLMHGEAEQAVDAAERQAACYREAPAPFGVQIALANAAFYECLLGQYESAISRLNDSLRELRRLRSQDRNGNELAFLACALILRDAPGDFEQSLAHGRTAWSDLRRQQRGDWLLFVMAVAFARHGDADKAALLLGHVDAAWAEEGFTLWPSFARLRRETLERIHATLGESRAAERMAAGARLGDDRAACVAFDAD